MNTIKKAILTTVIAMLFVAQTQAQIDLRAESSQLQMAYKSQPYLSFDVKYTYATETDPTTIIDSSVGMVKLSGSAYWGRLDSLEFMQNSSYNIVLYKPNAIMRIGNPEVVYQQVINFPVFDSLVGKNNYTLNTTDVGNSRTVLLTFTNSSFAYKNFRVVYDKVTHLVQEIVYVINDEVSDYADSYNRTPSGGPNTEFMVVRISFSNYQTSPFSATVFNTGNYFLPNGNVFTPQPPFQSYEVFVASPNLIK
jgi:hypothetical protein